MRALHYGQPDGRRLEPGDPHVVSAMLTIPVVVCWIKEHRSKGQVPFYVLSVDLRCSTPKRRPQQSTSWEQKILPSIGEPISDAPLAIR